MSLLSVIVEECDLRFTEERQMGILGVVEGCLGGEGEGEWDAMVGVEGEGGDAVGGREEGR